MSTEAKEKVMSKQPAVSDGGGNSTENKTTSGPSSQATHFQPLSSITSEGIDQNGVKAALEAKIASRPNKEALMEKVGAHKGMADKIQGKAKKLEFQMKADALKRNLAERPGQDELMDKVGVTKGVAAKIQGAAKKLEFQMKSDNLNRHLARRKSVDDLPESQKAVIFPESQMAPSLRAVGQKLKMEFTKNKLGQLLQKRPNPEEIVASGTINPNISSKLKATARVLEHNMKVDKLGHLLEDRTDIDELKKRGIIKETTGLAPALQAKADKLEKKMKSDKLGNLIKRRSSFQDLEQRGILPSSAIPDDLKTERKEGKDYVGMTDKTGENGINEDQKESVPEPLVYQRETKTFHLARILLKIVAMMGETGEITAKAKAFDAEGDLENFKANLLHLTTE
ncbi:hypothetical protein AAMO2058_001309200 [Amorphochlora amoebiformis]